MIVKQNDGVKMTHKEFATKIAEIRSRYESKAITFDQMFNETKPLLDAFVAEHPLQPDYADPVEDYHQGYVNPATEPFDATYGL